MHRSGLTARHRGPSLSAAVAAAALSWLALSAPAQAASQGPVADGPYVGTLPCADCAGIRTTLTLYTMGRDDLPLVYRMTATYLGTPDGDRTEERLGPWLRVGNGAEAVVRIEPWDDSRRQGFRRAGADRLVLLDRDEKPAETRHDLSLVRDAAASVSRLESPRTLFRGTLSRDSDRLLLAPCGCRPAGASRPRREAHRHAAGPEPGARCGGAGGPP